MKASASLVKSWMACSLQGKFSYVDRLPQLNSAPASFGSAVHLALELYNNGYTVQDAKDCFSYVWDHLDEFGWTPEIWPPRTSYGSYRERGLKFIDMYHEDNKWIDKTIIGTEHRFQVNFGRHTLSGIVDILEHVKGSKELICVDLKTGYRPTFENLRQNVQFTIYTWAMQQKEFWTGFPEDLERYPGFENGEELWEQYKNLTPVAIWYDLRNAKGYNVGPRTEQDYARLQVCLDNIERAMELEVFVPNISGDTCGICSYQDQCPAYVKP